MHDIYTDTPVASQYFILSACFFAFFFLSSLVEYILSSSDLKMFILRFFFHRSLLYNLFAVGLDGIVWIQQLHHTAIYRIEKKTIFFSFSFEEEVGRDKEEREREWGWREKCSQKNGDCCIVAWQTVDVGTMQLHWIDTDFQHRNKSRPNDTKVAFYKEFKQSFLFSVRFFFLANNAHKSRSNGKRIHEPGFVGQLIVIAYLFNERIQLIRIIRWNIERKKKICVALFSVHSGNSLKLHWNFKPAWEREKRKSQKKGSSSSKAMASSLKSGQRIQQWYDWIKGSETEKIKKIHYIRQVTFLHLLFINETNKAMCQKCSNETWYWFFRAIFFDLFLSLCSTTHFWFDLIRNLSPNASLDRCFLPSIIFFCWAGTKSFSFFHTLALLYSMAQFMIIMMPFGNECETTIYLLFFHHFISGFYSSLHLTK